MHGLCGPRHVHKPEVLELADARTRRDPTGTHRVRGQMRAESDRRWQVLARTLRQALTEHDLVGLRGLARLPHGDKTEKFAQWLHEEIRQKVFGYDGRWLRPYVNSAAGIAQSQATESVGGAVDPGRVTTMGSLAASELRGICEAAEQQIVRVVTHCMMANASPTRTANAAAGVIRTMRDRTRAMSNYVVAKTHATASLSAFRSAGVTRVGTVPERVRIKQTKHGKVLDAPADKPTPAMIARAERAQAKLEQQVGTEGVEVITAGDDKVCEECQDISDRGPYDLDRAEGLIPAHLNCRCAFVPLSDERFAEVEHEDAQQALGFLVAQTTHVEQPVSKKRKRKRRDALDAFDPDEARDPHGRWSSGDVDPSREHIEADPAYFYHATAIENARDIIASGQLDTHKPGYGTDQDEWPDGGREKRSYWTHDPQVARSFYPEGKPALLRARRESADFKRESTGDMFLRKAIPVSRLEVYSGQGVWEPLSKKTSDAFDPDEPRDPQGKWTSGGGSGAGQETGQAKAGAGGRGPERPGGGGRDTSLEEAQRSAETAAAGFPKLEGLPDKPIKIGDQYYVPGPFGKAIKAADDYLTSAGLPHDAPKTYQKVDKERATRIANAFDQMQHNPDDPAVQASYAALAKETLAQWQAIKKTGLQVEWIKPGQADPYAATPRLAAMDVTKNNHWWGFPTDQGFGTGPEATAATHNNPMLAPTSEVVDGRKLVVNDVFRIVHDYFGHFKEGVGFRADGEENAWRSHAAMYSEAARPAMTAETRGQNSWVNYGPYGEFNRKASAADTHYAPQKIGVMPKWAQDEGRRDP